jgi:hypothetical protein
VELDKETVKISIFWLIGGTLFITGIQLILLLPLHLLDVLFFDWDFIPNLTYWKGFVTLILGIVMVIVGGKLAEPGEKQFFDSTGGESS